ncbi:potassium/proton antiporter [Rhodocista pekingensis]|uniref:Potassium/proton antiporter n=1 Tax=Rhodocista pekingensis TaxID=201185 RepID=A0ABW2KUX5_9PROT
MEAVNDLILLAGALLLLAIVAGLVSSRVGAPLLLVFLGLGMLAGEDGPGGIPFGDYQVAYLVGSVALAVILFDGGLRTRRETFRQARWPALVLATVGVLLTAAATGAAAVFFLGTGWEEGLLIGAIVGSTDAAAVFFLLNTHGLGLRPRLSATLEVESGLNDPMAIFLTLLGIQLVTATAPLSPWVFAHDFALQLLGGVALGIAAGHALAWAVNRIRAADGLYPILALSGALFIFGVAQWLGSSGFMAVYVTGFVLGNRRHRADLLIRRFHDGLAWLAQIALFVMLGLLVTPSALEPLALPGLMIALVLVLAARPLAVALCLLPFRFAWNEIAFVGWVGLRGAVPIVLGTLPVLAGVEGAQAYFGIAFVVVLVSLVVQGWTIGPAARLLRVEVPPDPAPPPRIDIDLPMGEEQLAMFTAAPDSEAVSRGLGRLVIPESVRVLAMLREGRPVPPEEVRALQPGDSILVLGETRALAVLDRLFGQRRAAARRAGAAIGDFQVQGMTPAATVGRLYAIEEAARAEGSIAAFLETTLGRRPSPGDRVRAGSVDLIVCAMEGESVTTVGIDLTPVERPWRRLRSRLLRRPQQPVRDLTPAS